MQERLRKRMRIKRIDDEVLALDGQGVPYDITNPQAIPKGQADGIFTVFPDLGTARFESTHVPVPYTCVRRTEVQTVPLTPVRANDTTVYWNDDVRITVWKDEVLVDTDKVHAEVRKFLGALIVEGLDPCAPCVSRALRYIIKT